MKYYDPTTRKRPEFQAMYNTLINTGKFTGDITGTRILYVLCSCGLGLATQAAVYDHWQQGHFDIYEEYNDKNTSNKAV